MNIDVNILMKGFKMGHGGLTGIDQRYASEVTPPPTKTKQYQRDKTTYGHEIENVLNPQSTSQFTLATF